VNEERRDAQRSERKRRSMVSGAMRAGRSEASGVRGASRAKLSERSSRGDADLEGAARCGAERSRATPCELSKRSEPGGRPAELNRATERSVVAGPASQRNETTEPAATTIKGNWRTCEKRGNYNETRVHHSSINTYRDVGILSERDVLPSPAESLSREKTRLLYIRHTRTNGAGQASACSLLFGRPRALARGPDARERATLREN